MAISANSTFETRTTGNDLNAGFFVTGATGTDKSTADSPFVTFDGVTILAVTSGTSATITITGYTVVNGDVGNGCNITGGTNFTTGRYEISSVNTGANTWTFDRNCSSGIGAAMTGRMGGALATVSTLLAQMKASNIGWVKGGTYSEGNLTGSAAGVTPSATVHPTSILGYSSSRGDLYPGSAGTRPVLQNSASGTKINMSNSGWLVANLDISKVSSTMTTCINVQASSFVINCKCNNFSGSAITTNSNCTVAFCEVTGGSGNTSRGIDAGTTCAVYNNYVHDCTGGNSTSAGIVIDINGIVFGNIVDTFSGSVTDGIQTGNSTPVINNTVYSCGRDGIRMTGQNLSNNLIKGNILSTNVGNAVASANSGFPATWRWDGNAFYNNGGTRSNIDSTTGVYSTGAYTNRLDVSLSADPFKDAANADFRLNNDAGGGRSCRAAGFPNAYPGLGTLGYRDMGAVQHLDGEGAGTLFYTPAE